MKRKISFLALGLVVGSLCGFKWANYNYRRDQNAGVIAQAAQAAANLKESGGGAAGAASNEQGRQMINEVTAIIKKARENPNDFDAQRNAADQFLQIQRPEGALEYLNNAIRLKPDSVETMTRLAQAHFFTEKFDESIKWSRAALKRQPDSEAATYYLTAALIVSKQNLNEAAGLISQLEAKRGANDALLSELRARLGEARQAAGGAPQSQPQPQSKTMLQHGPDAGGVKK
jgi:tetratricopeptide (TPR) repeat protein